MVSYWKTRLRLDGEHSDGNYTRLHSVTYKKNVVFIKVSFDWCLVTGLGPRKSGFDPTPFYMRFVVKTITGRGLPPNPSGFPSH